MAEAALKISKLRKAYGRLVALDGLSFEVPAGELCCLIGPNGAGKSTAMRIIAGLQMADEGKIWIGGRACEADPLIARGLCGITPQELELLDVLSAEETLRFVARMRGLSNDEAEERISRWLRITSLEAARGRMVGEFSGGMRRKLAVAASMLAPLPLVILDESFTGLDPESTRALQKELRVWCDEGRSVLLSSHVLDMVERIADRVIVMDDGVCVRELDRAALREEIPTRFGTLTDLYLHETRAGS